MPRPPNVGLHGDMTVLDRTVETRDPLLTAVRAERVARLRADKARRSAAICEWRARRLTATASMYHAEARRLRAAADQHESDAARHAAAVGRLRLRTASSR